jgi:hypothetical protein
MTSIGRPGGGVGEGARARLRRVAAVADRGYRRAWKARASPPTGVHLRVVARATAYESLTLHH